MEITQEDLDKWIALLKGGTIKQITAALHEHGIGMCCLGVFCEAQKDKLPFSIDYGIGNMVLYDDEIASLPRRVRERFHTTGSGPQIPLEHLTDDEKLHLKMYDSSLLDGPRVSVMALNDYSFTFERIAELIPYGVTIINNYDERKPVLSPAQAVTV
jgi:hypothetical protein